MDREYFWIAVEAMIAPLPANWKEYFEGDQAYYFNENTSECRPRTAHPCVNLGRSGLSCQQEEEQIIHNVANQP